MSTDPFSLPSNHNFLAGGATAGQAIRDFDWCTTPLGAPAGWPESLKTLVSLLHASNQPMFIVWGPQHTLLYNEAYSSILATKHPSAMCRNFLEVWFEIRDILLPMVEKVYSGETVQMDDIELQLQRSGFAEEAHFSFFYSPVRDGAGAVSGLFCACNEITAQVLIQRQLREREARYRGVLNHMDEAFALLDSNFCVLEINDAAMRMESRSRESMLHRSHWELFPGTEDSELGRMYKQCMADGIGRTLEHHYGWGEAGDRWLEVRAKPTPAGLALFYRDISQRRGLEQRAAESSERVQLALAKRDQANNLLQTIVAAVPGLVYAKDLQGRLLVANQGTADLLGKPVQALLGKTDLEYLNDPAQAQAIMANDRRIMQSGQSEQVEEAVLRPDGRPSLWLSTKAPLYGIDGKVMGLIGASIDITEIKRIEESLRESDRRKDEFLAMLGHELRNPLAPIRMVGELLEKKLAAEPEYKPMLSVLVRQTMHLTRLVDDLLDVARVTHGRVTLKLESVEWGAVIDQAIESVQTLAAEKFHALRIHRPSEKLYVSGDYARLVQIVTNLLNNAVKYTDPHGTITLAVSSTGQEIVLSVQDTGIGISAELLPHIFDLFVQSECSLDRSQGGLGIGLSVVRRLVGLHHGTLQASSGGLGQGSTFEIRLPRISAPSKAAEPVIAASSASRRVLIVDDNQDAADTLALLLAFEGHQVDVVYRSTDVLDHVSQQNPDVVLLDIGMPVMNGYAVARALRARHGHSLRLIAITGYGLPEDRERTSAAGFDAHLVKPVDVETLLLQVAG